MCWQYPREDSRATDSSVSNASLSHNGKGVDGVYGELAEARRVRARLLAWFQSMVPGFGAPIPARTGLERIRPSTE